MGLEYKITRAGGENRTHVDFTVTFNASSIADSDTEEIRHGLAKLLSHRNIGNGVYREISVFVKNNRAVVIFNYDDVGQSDHKQVQVDFDETLEHIREILELFNVNRNS